MKSSGTAAVGFLVVTVLWRLVIGGNPKSVWCRWKTPCLLEANFSIGDDVVIHWKRESPSKLQVHSFYYEKDQLQEQDQHFRGRTSLFKENIPKGNASLLLTNVVVPDEGTYMCYVGTLTGQWRSFIKLNVEAAVTSSFRLDDEDQLICSSGGIFPQPALRWSTEPALPDALRNSSQVQQETQTQLYNITGSLALAGDAHPDLKYICDISNTVSSQRITWRKTTNRSTSLQTLYCWIVGPVVALTVLVLIAMLVYLKMRGKATKSSSREEETDLNSVKGVEGESEKSNHLPARGNNEQTGPS